MNENNTTVAVEEPKAPKASKPAAKKAPVKATKAPAKKAAKPAAEPAQRKLLNTPQTWILKTLAKAKGLLNRNEIAERAGKAGCSTSKGRISDEAGNYGYLVEKKFAKLHEVKVEGKVEWSYEITAAGRKALESVS